jgi:hypothetical protein
MRSCGACALCCKVMAIDELAKPMGSWCPNCRPGRGCSIYGEHPASCRTFSCQWLDDTSMPEELRPDRTKVVLVREGDRRLVARCDPGFPSAWRAQPINSHLRRIAAATWSQDLQVAAMVNGRVWLITPKGEVEVGEVDPRSPFIVEKRSDGSATVRVLPPLAEGEAFDPDAIATGLGYRAP